MTKTKILIIEDEGIVALDLQTRLQNLGYSITGLESTGKGGLASIKKKKPDLVLLDIVISGGMDGIEVANLIREYFAIPIIFVTSHSDSKTFNKAKRTEPYGYILKPYEEKDLQTTIDIALYKSKIEKELIRSKEALKLANELLEEKVAERTMKLSTINKQLLDEISLHKRTAIELENSEVRYRWLFENAMVAIVSIDRRGKVGLFNPAAEKMFGYKEAEMKGENIGKIIPARHRGKHNRYIQMYEKHGDYKIIGRERRLEAINKSGKKFLIELRVNEGEIAGNKFYIGFIKDISETVRIERELDAERKKRLSAIIDGQELERKRLSQEVHDGIGQMLLGIKLNVGRITDRDSHSKDRKERNAEVIELINDTMAEVKRISQNLSPSVLDDFGLKPALKRMAFDLSNGTDVSVKFSTRRVPDRFLEEFEIGTYRIAQEAVNNAVIHGRATRVKIELLKSKDYYKLTIQDNGSSFNVSNIRGDSGHGIYNMHERASLLGGQLEIISVKNKGTKVVLKIRNDRVISIE